VSAYEAMKLRLLDGGYCAISYMAFLLGHREMDEAMADARVASFLRSYYAEVVTTVCEPSRGLMMTSPRSELVNILISLLLIRVGFKCPYSNRRLKPLNRLFGGVYFVVHSISKSPFII
jgi:hypothetical protein